MYKLFLPHIFRCPTVLAGCYTLALMVIYFQKINMQTSKTYGNRRQTPQKCFNEATGILYVLKLRNIPAVKAMYDTNIL